jgi:predicted nucleotidyltransferase
MSNPTKQALTLDDLRRLREEILAIARRNKAYNVRVFGSVARGDATPTSDVDFLVSFEEGASLYDLSGIVLDLKDLLGCDVDVADDQTRDRDFLKRIARDVIAL